VEDEAMIGTTIGSYEVLSKLGEGGMGEVYLARDTKLGREVALKILPPQFASDPERLARFEREARALAALNHPRIAAIYGLEESGGQRVLVIELALGSSLAERLARGPLPVREALAIARQIAEGVEAAHEKGILHRDLKPANIQVADQGEVKILDFGLAKALDPGSKDPGFDGQPTSAATLGDSPTAAAPTRHGVILGTAAYMSPEQARGLAVDTRTDIWAFGCVLYECLTGKRAFPGDTITDTLAAVLERDPDWAVLPAATPANVRVLLARCLRKETRERLRDIGDARIELGDPVASGATAITGSAPVGAPRRAWRHPIPIGLACATVALGAALLWFLLRAPANEIGSAAVSRLSVLLPPGHQLAGEGRALAISPDGQELVLAVEQDRGRPGPLDDTIQLYRPSMDDQTVMPIPGTEMCGRPFFSPDGEWLGFSGPDGLKKLSLRGGAPIAVSGATAGTGTWMHDNRLVYTTQRDLFRVPAGGGLAETLLSWSQLQKGEIFIEFPSAIPGTEAFLLDLAGFDSTRSTIAAWSGGVLTRVLTGGLMPIYLPTGHVLYERLTHPGGNRYDAYVVPFDLPRMRVTGTEVPVLQDVRFGQLAVSAAGTLAYNSNGDDRTTQQLVWLDRTGATAPVADKQIDLRYTSPRLSPDGARLLYAIGHDNRDARLFVRDLVTGAAHTVGGMSSWWGAWTPDAERVVYIQMNPEGTAGNLFWQSADGAGQAERLTKSDRHQQPLFVTPDGNALVFNEQSPDTGYDLWQLSLHGDHTPRPVLRTNANEHLAALTRNGRYMAYASDETGRDEIWVRVFPGGEGAQQVSTEGGTAPLWAVDGRTLFYRDAAGTRLFAVPVTWDPGPSFGPPTMVNGWWRPDTAWARNYDIAPDGKRLVLIAGTSTAGNEITIVLNWFEELKQKLAAK
jgi:eukaryotic-like serine/threonine-protein kinase